MMSRMCRARPGILDRSVVGTQGGGYQAPGPYHFFCCFKAVESSSRVKGADRSPSTPGACHRLEVICLVWRVWFLSVLGKRPFSRSCSAIELAVTGHFFGLGFLPVRRLNVFQASLLE